MIKFGLIGRNVKYSFSKEIHERILNEKYELISLENEEAFLEFLKTDFNFVNVTIPYKQVAFKQCDVLSKEAKETGVVNLIIKKDKKLYGYNTDAYGFASLLGRYSVNVINKNCLILGTGASSKTVEYVLKQFGASSVKFLSRIPHIKTAYNYSDLSPVKDSQVIINTTPIGNFENKDIILLNDLSTFKNIDTYIDLNYNIATNKQALLMKENGVKTINGLFMLVAQAFRAEEIYLNNYLSSEEIYDSYLSIFKQNFNISLIGHPFSGKTSIGKILSEKMDMKFVDIDSEIESKSGKTIPEIFAQKGEAYFRDLEKEIINSYSSQKGYVISTGGGSILDPQNIQVLEETGLVVNLTRDVRKINSFENRPLVKCIDDLIILINDRKKLYKKYADFEVVNEELESTVEAIRRMV